jgi:hypothetical protein
MTIDRLLILCSLTELIYFGCKVGVGCYTPFQWIALTLLGVKLFLVLRARRGHRGD